MNCYYADERILFLVRLTFERKLRLLKNMGVLNLEEFRIHGFQERRNRFFHTVGAAEMHVLSEDEKERLMDEAVKVAQLTFDILPNKQRCAKEVLRSVQSTRRHGRQKSRLDLNVV